MQTEKQEQVPLTKRALPPIKFMKAQYSTPVGYSNYLSASFPTNTQKILNDDLKQVTALENTSPIKSSIKHGLTIDTRMIRNNEKFKNLMPVRFERSQRSSLISNEATSLNRTDGFNEQRLPDFQDQHSRRKKVSSKAIIVEEQPPPPTQCKWKLRDVSPTELIKISLAFHGQLQGGAPLKDYMDMLRDCRRLTPSSNSRYGKKKFYSPRDSRYSSSFFFSPNNSKGFQNSSREDNSPLKKIIAARNERQASTGVENLFASDFSTVMKIKIENEAAEQARKPRYRQPSLKKQRPLQPKNAEKRAINRMFSKKSQESQEEVKVDPKKAKISFNAPITIASMEHSFLDRVQQPKNQDLIVPRKPLEKILSIGNIRKNLDKITQTDVNETKRSKLTKEMAMNADSFLRKSAFQQGIKDKLNRLDYLKLPQQIVAKHYTIESSEIKHYQTKLERPECALSNTEDEKRELPASPFRQKVFTKKINRSSQNGSSMMMVHPVDFSQHPVNVSQSELEFESRLLKRPEQPARRAELKRNLIMKVSSALTIPDAPFSRASLLPSVNKRYKQHVFESSTASLNDIYVSKGTSPRVYPKQTQTVSPAKFLGQREIAESLQSQLLTHSAIYIA